MSFDGIVTTPFNSPDTRRARGFEFGHSQAHAFLPGMLAGLGLRANYPFMKASCVKQSMRSSTDPEVAAGAVATVDGSRLPLQRLSKHTFNIQPFYQHGQLELLGADAWRSRFLRTSRRVIVPFGPISAKASGPFDASAFVNVAPQFLLGVQGYNPTAATTRTSQVINSQPVAAPRSWFVADRRVTLSLCARFGQ